MFYIVSYSAVDFTVYLDDLFSKCDAFPSTSMINILVIWIQVSLKLHIAFFKDKIYLVHSLFVILSKDLKIMSHFNFWKWKENQTEVISEVCNWSVDYAKFDIIIECAVCYYLSGYNI